MFGISKGVSRGGLSGSTKAVWSNSPRRPWNYSTNLPEAFTSLAQAIGGNFGKLCSSKKKESHKQQAQSEKTKTSLSSIGGTKHNTLDTKIWILAPSILRQSRFKKG
jgi:hypothetical protein